MAFIPIIASVGASLVGSLLNHGSSSSSAPTTSTTPTEGLSYQAPTAPSGSTFDWQQYAGAWEAIGVALLALLLLGSFDATRPLAIIIAAILGGTLILSKIGGP